MFSELRDTVAQLGDVAAGMADRLATFVTAPAAGSFAELEDIDMTVDQLHAGMLTQTSAEDFVYRPQVAANLALIAMDVSVPAPGGGEIIRS